MLIDLDAERVSIEVKLGGEKYTLHKPKWNKLELIQEAVETGQAKVSDIKDLILDSGFPKEKINELDIDQMRALIRGLSGDSKKK